MLVVRKVPVEEGGNRLGFNIVLASASSALGSQFPSLRRIRQWFLARIDNDMLLRLCIEPGDGNREHGITVRQIYPMGTRVTR